MAVKSLDSNLNQGFYSEIPNRVHEKFIFSTPDFDFLGLIMGRCLC